jgi:hypothetical protein
MEDLTYCRAGYASGDESAHAWRAGGQLCHVGFYVGPSPGRNFNSTRSSYVGCWQASDVCWECVCTSIKFNCLFWLSSAECLGKLITSS